MCKHCDSDWEKPLFELDNEDGQPLITKIKIKQYGGKL